MINTYSNTCSFFFLTILILHHKSAHNQKEIQQEMKNRKRLIPSFWDDCQISQSQTRRWRSCWRYFSVRCWWVRLGDWWQFATVAKVTYTHTQRGVSALPLSHSQAASLLLWIIVIVGWQRQHRYCWFHWNAVYSLCMERWHYMNKCNFFSWGLYSSTESLVKDLLHNSNKSDKWVLIMDGEQ